MQALWFLPGAAAVLYTCLLIRREPFHLGMVIPALCAAPLIYMAFAQPSPARQAAAILMGVLLAGIVVLCLLLLLGARIRKPDTPPQWILIPGYALHAGHLTKTLAMRLDCAAALAQKHPESRLILSGGSPRPGPTEASIMKDYLLARGIPESRILTEDQSASSWQNMTACKALWDQAGRPRVHLVTSAFHMLRMRWCAQKAGLQITPVPCASPLWLLPAEILREGILLVKTAVFGFASMAWANGKL